MVRKLFFEPNFQVSVEKIWSLFVKVEDYPRYIEYCRGAELVGDFKAGSTWYDWSSVVVFPLKVIHQIEKIDPNREIIYRIDLPSGGEIRQRFYLEELPTGTKVVVEISINFQNRFVDFTLGPFVAYRNQKMITATIENIREVLNDQTN